MKMVGPTKKIAAELLKLAKELVAIEFNYGDRVKSTINTDAKTKDGKKVKIHKNDVFDIVVAYGSGNDKTFHLQKDKNVTILIPEWALKVYFVPAGEY